MNFVEGRCLGGGSEVSGGLYYRTPPQVLARWQEDYRVDDVVPSSLEPHFANCEQILRIDYVEDCFNQAKNILERGAAALGWNVTKVKSCHFVDESGRIRRTSAGTSFMRLGRELGAMIHTGVRGRRISRENRVYELHCAIDGRVQTVRCETVFVCAGATQTPLLLMRSGVTKNVGRALRFQPIVKLVAEFEEEVNSGTARMPPYHIRNSDSRFMLGSSVSTPDQVALNLLPYPEVLTTIEDRWKRMLIFHIGITSTSAGRIIAVGDQTEPLVLYHASSEDVEKLNDGLSKMSRLLLHAGAKSIYVNGRGMEPIHDMHQVPNDYQRRQLNLFCYHLSSSCPMGEKEEICAVDSFGRVEKDGNVIVSDSSVLCTSPSVNPQGTILAIARRNVLRFLDRA
jgi:choline dehydrogenase-like flavoprotein